MTPKTNRNYNPHRQTSGTHKIDTLKIVFIHSSSSWLKKEVDNRVLQYYLSFAVSTTLILKSWMRWLRADLFFVRDQNICSPMSFLSDPFFWKLRGTRRPWVKVSFSQYHFLRGRICRIFEIFIFRVVATLFLLQTLGCVQGRTKNSHTHTHTHTQICILFCFLPSDTFQTNRQSTTCPVLLATAFVIPTNKEGNHAWIKLHVSKECSVRSVKTTPFDSCRNVQMRYQKNGKTNYSNREKTI
jgi:hypothetical protein